MTQNTTAPASLRVSYQLYPEVTLGGLNESATWFELALHAEGDEYRPASLPASLEARFVLTGLADFLIGQLQPFGPFNLTRAETNTLHPEAPAGVPRVRIARTLSLVFSDVGAYTARTEPRLLTQLRAELNRLGLDRLPDPN